uniref:Uncharacterized protein n=1 Tax=Cacopsylla melanoneura TaxID=428564 RepID=A0A8D9AVS4_9HEMI
MDIFLTIRPLGSLVTECSTACLVSSLAVLSIFVRDSVLPDFFLISLCSSASSNVSTSSLVDPPLVPRTRSVVGSCTTRACDSSAILISSCEMEHKKLTRR